MDWLLAMKVAQIIVGLIALVMACGSAQNYGRAREDAGIMLGAMLAVVAMLVWAVLT